MKQYLTRLQKLVDELSSNQYVTLLSKEIGAPVNNEMIEDLQRKINYELNNELLDVYRELNGCCIKWKFNRDLLLENKNLIEKIPPNELMSIQAEKEFGCINILPLEKCLMDKSFYHDMYIGNEMVNFMNSTIPRNELPGLFNSFDCVSEYYMVVVIAKSKTDMAKCMLLSDYYAEWDYSMFCNLDTYFDILVITKGIINLRRRVLGKYNGHLLAPFSAREKIYEEFEIYNKIF